LQEKDSNIKHRQNFANDDEGEGSDADGNEDKTESNPCFARGISPFGFYPAKAGFLMGPHFRTIWTSAEHMVDSFLARLPSLVLAIIVFLIFYFTSIVVSRIIRRATQSHRQNLGMVFARLAGAALTLLGFLVAFSIVAPSFQAGDLIKVLGIGSVAIGFAFQNILQNFLAGLLLLWAEPFRVGDQIKLDTYEGTVEDIQTRATTIKTYDGRRVVIPNAELFTHSVTVNTAFATRRWEYDLSAKAAEDLAGVKSLIIETVRKVDGVLAEPAPEALVIDLGDADSGVVKLRLTWWTKSSRQHQLIASHDRVLTAVREVLSRLAATHDQKPHAAPSDRRRIA
jgi:small conductance mechanosensitive channel